MIFKDDDADEPRARRGLFDSDDPPVYGILDPTPRGGLMSNLVAAPSDPYDPLWPIMHYGLPRPPFPATGPVTGLPYPTGTFPPAYPPGALGSPLPWPRAPWLSAAPNAGDDQTGWRSPSWPGVPDTAPPARPQVIRGLLQEDDDLPPGSALLGEPAPAPRVVLGLFDDLEAFGKPQAPLPAGGSSDTVLAQAGGAPGPAPNRPSLDYALDAIERNFRNIVPGWRKQNLPQAATNLEWFLDGGGKERVIDRDEARQMEPILRAQTSIESNAERSLLDRHGHLRDLADLEDGQTVHFQDDLKQVYGDLDFALHAVNQSRRDFALAFGNTRVESKAYISATRAGDEIRVEGTVEHHWNDRYDFHPDRYPGFGGLGAKGAAALEQYRGAKPFAIRSSWPRRVSGTIRIENGELKGRDFQWEDIEQ